jgi:hypothetical protein
MSRTDNQRAALHRDRQSAAPPLREAAAHLPPTLKTVPDFPADPQAIKTIACNYTPIIFDGLAKVRRLAGTLSTLAAAARAGEYVDSSGFPTAPVTPGLVAASSDIGKYIDTIEADLRAGLFSPRSERRTRDKLPDGTVDAYQPERPPLAIVAPSILSLPPIPVTITLPPMPPALVEAIAARDAARARQGDLEAASSELARRKREGADINVADCWDAMRAADAAKVERMEAKAAVDLPHSEWRASISAMIRAAYVELLAEIRDSRANCIIADDMIQMLHRAGMKHGLIWCAPWGGAPALRASEALIDCLMSERSPRRDQVCAVMAHSEVLRAQTSEAEVTRKIDIEHHRQAEIDRIAREVEAERFPAAARGNRIHWGDRS